MLCFKNIRFILYLLLIKTYRVSSLLPADNYYLEEEVEAGDESLLDSEEFQLDPKSDFGSKLLLSGITESEGRGKGSQGVSYVWREQAKVSNLTDTRSYSGFFTVNKQYNSNLFFWFFPAAFEPEKAPLILWLNGGPGSSSLFGLFVEHGPFKVNNDGFLELRQYAWTLSNSIIYLDSPVGTGFSYTDNPKGYAKDQKDISNDIYEALVQFFRVFPDFQDRDLYIAGESYAGKYIPSIGFKIHIENKNEYRSKKMNLKGFIIGSGFTDPLTQNEYGEYLYNLGLIDERQKNIFLEEEDRIRSLIEAEDWRDATEAVQSLILGYPSRFHNATDYKFYLNLLSTEMPQEYKNYVKFLNKDHVRRSIHVGDQPFGRNISTVRLNLLPDICKSVKPKVEKLLEENYRMLIYASMFDIIVPHTGIDKFVSSLDWPGAKAYAKAARKPWRVNGELAGYTKFARNLAHVFIRNAGHVAPYDQPAWLFDMINRFTKGKAF